jgi:hypothetical protein
MGGSKRNRDVLRNNKIQEKRARNGPPTQDLRRRKDKSQLAASQSRRREQGKALFDQLCREELRQEQEKDDSDSSTREEPRHHF